MLLIALAVVLGSWAVVIAVVVSLCVGAARADRELMRRTQRSVRRAHNFRLAAHR